MKEPQPTAASKRRDAKPSPLEESLSRCPATSHSRRSTPFMRLGSAIVGDSSATKLADIVVIRGQTRD